MFLPPKTSGILSHASENDEDSCFDSELNSWRPDQINEELHVVDEKFDEIFLEMYEEQFIDQIFEEFRNTIKRY